MLSNNMFTQEAKDKIISFFIGRNVLMCGNEVRITDISDTWSTAWFTLEMNYDRSFSVFIDTDIIESVFRGDQFDVSITNNTSPVALPGTYLMKRVCVGDIVLEGV